MSNNLNAALTGTAQVRHHLSGSKLQRDLSSSLRSSTFPLREKFPFFSLLSVVIISFILPSFHPFLSVSFLLLFLLSVFLFGRVIGSRRLMAAGKVDCPQQFFRVAGSLPLCWVS